MTIEDNGGNVNEIKTLTLFDDYILVYFNNDSQYSLEYPSTIGEQPSWSAYYNNFDSSPAKYLEYYYDGNTLYSVMLLQYPGGQQLERKKMTYTSRTGRITYTKMNGEALLSSSADITSINIGDDIVSLACPLCEDGDGLLTIYTLNDLKKIIEYQGNQEDDERDNNQI